MKNCSISRYGSKNSPNFSTECWSFKSTKCFVYHMTFLCFHMSYVWKVQLLFETELFRLWKYENTELRKSKMGKVGNQFYYSVWQISKRWLASWFCAVLFSVLCSRLAEIHLFYRFSIHKHGIKTGLFQTYYVRCRTFDREYLRIPLPVRFSF